MGRRKIGQSGRPSLPRGIHSPRVQLTLYSLLLVATPFIMLRNFLQSAIGKLSLSTFSVGGLAIPIVPTVAAALVAALLWTFRPKLTRRRLIAAAAAVAMIALAQQITDFYFGHRFYELQVNWHYIAYGIFALLAYRDLTSKGRPLARILLTTFGLAILYSAFDEGLQLAITSRIFDMSDIGKDAWGALTGITALLIAKEHKELAGGKWRRIRRPSLRAYFDHAPSVWVLITASALFLLGFSSLLADVGYTWGVLALTIVSSLAFFLLLHLSQFRLIGRAMLALAVISVLAGAIQIFRHRDDGIAAHRYGLTVYKGIPIPFFDVMLFPEGGFRLVDKKHYFNARDREIPQSPARRRRSDRFGISGTWGQGLSAAERQPVRLQQVHQGRHPGHHPPDCGSVRSLQSTQTAGKECPLRHPHHLLTLARPAALPHPLTPAVVEISSCGSCWESGPS